MNSVLIYSVKAGAVVGSRIFTSSLAALCKLHLPCVILAALGKGSAAFREGDKAGMLQETRIIKAEDTAETLPIFHMGIKEAPSCAHSSDHSLVPSFSPALGITAGQDMEKGIPVSLSSLTAP